MKSFLKRHDELAAGAAWYDENAEKVILDYESLDARSVHPELFAMLEGRNQVSILDVGAGTGRDASALACAGHKVIAVDPSPRMIELARDLHPECGVEWKVDGLPKLEQINETFDLIVVSAVWMHVPPSERASALRRLTVLLDERGTIYATLRTGPDNLQRGMFSAAPEELEFLAQSFDMRVVRLSEKPDLLGRAGVIWHTLSISLSS